MEENKIVENKPVKKLSLYIIGGIALTLYVLYTAFLIYGYFDLRADMAVEGGQIAYALVFALMVIAFGIATYFATTILSSIGLTIAIVKRKKGLNIRWVVAFLIMTVLPIVTEIFMILLYQGLNV